MADDTFTKQDEPVEEFEREPVPERAWLGFSSFVGQYAGEHTAGTELMIGPLFIASGVSATAVVGGLFAGNLLAVLSWVFLTAPIAVRARMTLYFQLEKICGRKPRHGLQPGQRRDVLLPGRGDGDGERHGGGRLVRLRHARPERPYPNSLGWVVTVLVMGVLMTVVAAYGYKIVARIANIAAPWMVLVFIAYGIVGRAAAGHRVGGRVLAEGPGAASGPAGRRCAGQTKFTFWHVMFFAWFCNMAMHIGMADLSVFRYARKSWYAVGDRRRHVPRPLHRVAGRVDPLRAAAPRQARRTRTCCRDPLAYNAAGIAGAHLRDRGGLDDGEPDHLPRGPGVPGDLAESSRYRVTLFTGALATVAGMFPAIAMKLLDFVALYGLVLMPMGAVIFVDFWLAGSSGSNATTRRRAESPINWAAGHRLGGRRWPRAWRW